MEDLVLRSTEINTITLIDVRGSLDSSTSSQLRDLITGLNKKGCYKIICDCEHLEYLSSAGLSVFNQYLELCRKNKGNLKLIKVSGKALMVIEFVGLSLLIDMYDDLDSAIESFEMEK